MNDTSAMKISKTAKNLASQIRELMFLRDVCSFQRTPIHILKKNLDFTVMIKHIMALNNIGIVNVTKDLDLTAHLKPNRIFVVSVNDLESINTTGGTVNDFVNGTSTSASDSADTLKLRKGERLTLVRMRVRGAIGVVELTGGRRRRRVGGGWRQRKRNSQRCVVPLRKMEI